MNPIAMNEDSEPLDDIIFVHGISGNPLQSWRTSRHFDYKPPELRMAWLDDREYNDKRRKYSSTLRGDDSSRLGDQKRDLELDEGTSPPVFARKTFGVDLEQLPESASRPRYGYIFTSLLFAGQLGCSVPLGTYRPQHQWDSGVLSSQNRGLFSIPDSLHMNLPWHIPHSLLHPGPELFVLSALTFGTLVALTYRFHSHKPGKTKEIVFKGTLAIGVAAGGIRSWMGKDTPPILVPWTVSLALLLAILVDEVWLCYYKERRDGAIVISEERDDQEG